MFCPNCGEELRISSQRFCHNCGFEVSSMFETAPQTTEKYQYEPIIKSQPRPHYPPPVISKQKPVISGGTGKNSKLCFAFGLVSLGISIFGLIISCGFYLMAQIYYFYYIFSYSIVIGMIFDIALVITGLVFGILSRVKKGKARYSESVNSLQKAGSVLGVIGIVFNAIALCLAFLAPWIVFRLLMPAYPPYPYY
ncbi:MAG: zinc-ribbon domain-containing protein [Candidatus Thorarchaeota archaeon]